MPTSGPLWETLAGAGGGLGAGLALGWWYFRRGAAEGASAADDDGGDAAPVPAVERDGVRAQLEVLERSHARCLDQLAERDRLVVLLRREAAGMAARLSDGNVRSDGPP